MDKWDSKRTETANQVKPKNEQKLSQARETLKPTKPFKGQGVIALY
jgi:hypothetical protein